MNLYNEWVDYINNLQSEHQIDVKIYNLYSKSMIEDGDELNKKWRIFSFVVSRQFSRQFLRF